MTVLDASTQPFLFPEPLREGVILARPNRFIMDVDFGDGAPVRCHCPAVSRIGGLDLAGRPCLVSDSHNAKRKMPLTVEAYSLQRPDDPDKRWIGINQNASNRYVEHFLRGGAFAAITDPVHDVRREVPLGDSRLDFLVNGDLYLEVKTPLVQMQTEIPPYVPRLPETPFSSTERALRHCASWPPRWPITSGPPSSTASTTTTSDSASSTAPPMRRCSPPSIPVDPLAWSCGRPISRSSPRGHRPCALLRTGRVVARRPTFPIERRGIRANVGNQPARAVGCASSAHRARGRMAGCAYSVLPTAPSERAAV